MRDLIYLGHAHGSDDMLAQELAAHLAPLERLEQPLRRWSEQELPPGTLAAVERDARLAQTRIIVLLVTVHFLVDERCMKLLAQALQLRQAGQAEVIAVIASPCSWDLTPLRQLDPLLARTPVCSFASHDEAWSVVVGRIREVAAVPGGDAQSALQLYLQGLRAEFDCIQLPLDIAGRRSVPLDELLIHLPLKLKTQPAPPGAQGSHASQIEQADQRDQGRGDQVWRIKDRIERQQPLLVTGGAGAGKSTLFASLVCVYTRAAIAALQRNPAKPLVRLPVVLVCRDLPEFPGAFTLEDVLTAQLRWWPLDPQQRERLLQTMLQALSSGAAILLVDGIDEISSTRCRRQLCRDLFQWALRARGSVVATARPEVLDSCREEVSRFEILEIATLQDNDKAQYVDRWCALSANLDGAYLKQRLCTDPRLIRLCESVHALSLVVLAYIADGTLPLQEVRLYRRLTELMIHWQRRGVRSRSALDANEILPHLEALAYRMQRHGRTRIAEPEVIECFDALRRATPQETILARRKPQVLLQELLARIGVLIPAGTTRDAGGMLRQNAQFLHQSWQAYFAAQAIIHGHAGDGTSVAERVLAHLLQDEVAWREVLLMAMDSLAELGAAQSTDALRALLVTDGSDRTTARRRSSLALQCLKSDLVVDRSTAEAVIRLALPLIAEDDTRQDRELLRALAGTQWRRVLAAALLDEYPRQDGLARVAIGTYYLEMVGKKLHQRLDVVVRNVERRTAILRGPRGADRRLVLHLLLLVEILFQTRGHRVGAVLPDPRTEALCELLLRCVEFGDRVVMATALWALGWLLNIRDATRAGQWLSPPSLARLTAVLRQGGYGADEMTLALGAELLSSRRGVARWSPADQQWLHTLAKIADGDLPQRAFVLPTPQIDDPATAAWLAAQLHRGVGPLARRRISLALARMGHADPLMVAPLVEVMREEGQYAAVRDEAMLWLARAGGRAGSEALLSLAREPSGDAQAYDLAGRALFGLIAAGDIEVLQAELARGEGAAGGYCKEFALALLGLSSPQGVETVLAWAEHEDCAVREACQRAIWKASAWDGGPRVAAPKYLTDLLAAETVCVLLVRGENPNGEKIFTYVAVRADRLVAFMKAQQGGIFYPEEFGIIVESGIGEPGAEVRERMSREYGFNHEVMVDIPNEDAVQNIVDDLAKMAAL